MLLPSGSDEEISPSAINENHIIGKRLRSSFSPEQTPSELKKKIGDEISENHKQSPESGLDQLKQSASSSITKEPYDTVGAMKECEKVVRIIRSKVPC